MRITTENYADTLKDERELVCREAIWYCYYRNIAIPPKQLEAFLKDERAEVCRAAIWFCIYRAITIPSEQLEAFLKDERETVRYAAESYQANHKETE